MLSEVPWGTFNTAKRAYAAAAAIAGALEQNRLDLAKRLCMQMMRWLILSVDCPRDPLLAWRLMFLQDPVPVVSPQRHRGGWISTRRCCPAQLTATIAKGKDFELLQKRLSNPKTEGNNSGRPSGGKGKPPPKGKGNLPAPE